MGAILSLLLLVAQERALQIGLLPGAGPGASADAWVVRVPLRGAPGVPEVRGQDGGIVVEIPDGKVDRTSTALAPRAPRGAGGPAGEEPDLGRQVQEITTATSHSRHRAVITLRLRPGATISPAAIEAQVTQGLCTLRIQKGRPVPAAPRGPSRSIQAAGEGQGDEHQRASVISSAGRPPQEREDRPLGTLGTEKGASATPALRAEGRSLGDVALRVTAALGLLGLAGGLLLRYRKRPADLRPTAIDIIATRMLGRSQRLLVVDVEQQRFLLSATAAGVQLLAPIGTGLPDEMPAERPEAAPARRAIAAEDPLRDVFADMLADVARPKPAPDRPNRQDRPDRSDRVEPAAPPAPAPEAQKKGPRPRPALQLVESRQEAPAPPAQNPVKRSLREDWETWIQDEQDHDAEAAPAAPAERPATGLVGRSLAEDPDHQSGSVDVSGLLALRRYRQGAGR